MSGISFAGVEEVSDIQYTRPGVIDVFEIEKVEFGNTKNKGTYYMGVTFKRKADQFSHSFFLSEKALPRVKTLVKNATGIVIKDDEVVYEEQFVKMLTGRKLGLKVTGSVDETSGKWYADLAFGGFCKPAANVSDLAFTSDEEEKNRQAAIAATKAATKSADAPTGEAAGTASAPATADPGKDIF